MYAKRSNKRAGLLRKVTPAATRARDGWWGGHGGWWGGRSGGWWGGWRRSGHGWWGW